MNYYERIQQSIDYMELHLEEDISLCECANKAYMSIASYYRLFFSITGMNAKEYLRSRRLTLALEDLKNNCGVLETAIKYEFKSADGFSRSFKKQFGLLPSQVKEHNLHNESLVQERINVMKDLFEDDASLEKYPDIKVIKNLEPMKVACFCYFGKCPEGYAFETLKRWFQQQDISLKDSGYRLFGYNNPDPQEGETEYAYEYCITIPDDLYEKLENAPENMRGKTYPKVYRKILTGGKYAVMSVRTEGKELGEQIMEAWPRLVKWLENSKYTWGANQYLEEHIGFSEEDDHIGGVDLYINIADYKELLHNEI